MRKYKEKVSTFFIRKNYKDISKSGESRNRDLNIFKITKVITELKAHYKPLTHMHTNETRHTDPIVKVNLT